MCTPSSAAWFDGGFTQAPSRTTFRGRATAAPVSSTEPKRKVELEIAGPANRFAETLAVFAAMTEGGLLKGLRVDGHLVLTQDSVS